MDTSKIRKKIEDLETMKGMGMGESVDKKLAKKISDLEFLLTMTQKPETKPEKIKAITHYDIRPGARFELPNGTIYTIDSIGDFDNKLKTTPTIKETQLYKNTPAYFQAFLGKNKAKLLSKSETKSLDEQSSTKIAAPKKAKANESEAPTPINSLNWKKLFKYPEKFKDYDGKFLFPPRIKHRLQPASLSKFDNESYVGQPKLNGSSCSIILSENSTIVKERHNTDFSRPPAYPVFNNNLVYLGVPLHRGNGFMCLVGEFMNKSKKDDSGKAFAGVCIWDIVAFENKILVGSTIEERINLLDDIYPNKEALTTENGTPYLFKTAVPDVFKVNNFYKDFDEVYKQLVGVDMVEGFVLKRKSGKLEMMVREENNTGWSVKVRKPTKNYQF
jgi:hypothetical protein